MIRNFTIVRNRTILTSLLLLILLSGRLCAQQFTRGIGVYPGDPKQYFGPSMNIDAVHYRNLALHRAVYQSSSYDYNLTGQLVTDGISPTDMPGWIVTSSSGQGILPRDGREHIIGRHGGMQLQADGTTAWIQVQMAGGYAPPVIDSIHFSGSLTADTLAAKPWVLTISGSNDGNQWTELAKVNGDASLPGTDAPQRFRAYPGQKITPQMAAYMLRAASTKRRALNYGFKLSQPANFTYYRVTGDSPNAQSWSLGDLNMYSKGKQAQVGGPYHFTSAWKSGGSGREWLYVDLGASCSFNLVKLNWIRAAVQGSVQVSADAEQWHDIAALPGNGANITELKLAKAAKGRYVRVLMLKPASPADGYILSEITIMGTGGPVPVAHTAAGMQANGTLSLSGGGWKLQRASMVKADGMTLSAPGFNDGQWLTATVPATTLVSYLNDGAVPEPNYGDNNIAISDSYFYDDFWYRDVFATPANYQNRKVYLNFDGINWEAEIYLNGHSIGRIEGAFTRGKFDVTGMLIPGGQNILAVKVIKNETPGFPTEQNRLSTDANGGELGADNPTFHASIGWDWIPTIRGRNTGIWNDVYLSASGAVTIEDPLVTSRLPLPDTSTADVSVQVTLNNYSQKAVNGTLHGQLGDVSFDKAVTLRADETKTLKLDPSTVPALHLQNPRLWWPNGYGNQELYNVSLSFITADGAQSDVKTFKTGIREMTYSDTGNLKIYVNGKRFIPRGGNMGFAEDLLRYRGREYDVAVRYHKEMNFNMIRNWVGQVGDDAFFEACDKYGIMIWQDFWLANPSDGPIPDHPDMFNNNLADFVKRIRNHPAIGLYVGRNEGNPPPAIQSYIDANLPLLAPGIRYIPNSASYTVSGGGPYSLQPMKRYFTYRATPKLHSEMGTPDPMSLESFKLTMPDTAIWPQSRLWGVHDFTLQGAQNGATFNTTIEQAFGKVDDEKQWFSLGQFMEYQGYRAMFEAQGKNRMGLLIWMSHPSWPTLVWQSYDYFFEPTAAYFGAKKASEPLHIQWNPVTDSVEVVNYSVSNGEGLTARMQIFSTDGKSVLQKQQVVSSRMDSRVEVMPVTVPAELTGIYLLRLELLRGQDIISSNDYLRGAMPDSSGGIGNLKGLVKLPLVKLTAQTTVTRSGDHWDLTTTVVNNTPVMAFNVRLMAVGDKSGNRILPAILSDNYFSILPGASRTVTIQVKNEDTAGENPTVAVEGFNVVRQ